MTSKPPLSPDEGKAPDSSAAASEDRTQLVSGPPPVDPAPVAAPADHNLPIGTTINNNYEITQLLKAGGMGEVYRGSNMFTGDPVAIKVVLQSLAHDAGIADLFKREARILGQLNDPAVVRYYNFVQDGGINRFCLIMEFIPGITLSDYMDQMGPVDEIAGKALLKRLAEGLDRAHDLEVIHRDLSPDNVMLRDGQLEKSVLIDFGIAKSNKMSEGTLQGQFAGKFKFVAPEQLGHFGGQIDPKTDVYGLGLLMAAALRGSPIDMGNSIVKAVEARQMIPDLDGVPEKLRPLLSHMLEPDPLFRPGDMKQVAAMVDDPSLIPRKYVPHSGPQVGDGILSTAPPTSLRRPPTAQLAMPTSPPPMLATAAQSEVKETREKAGFGSALLWFGFLAVGGLGFLGWQQGLFTPVEIAAPPQGNTPTPVVGDTTDQFLAGLVDAPCVYISEYAGGFGDGILEVFSPASNPYDQQQVVRDKWQDRFAASPDLYQRPVQQAQCAAVDLAHGLQAGQGERLDIVMGADRVASGEVVRATLKGVGDRAVWLALVTPQGKVYNLSGRLEVDGQDRVLNVSLQASGATQLFIAVATEAPLISASGARDGSQARQLMRSIEKEIKEVGTGRAALASFTVLPPPTVEQTPEIEEPPAEDIE